MIDNTSLSERMFVVVSEGILPGKMGSATSKPRRTQPGLTCCELWESQIAACQDQVRLRSEVARCAGEFPFWLEHLSTLLLWKLLSVHLVRAGEQT